MRRISPSMGAALPAALDRRVDIDVLRVFATYMLFIFHVAKVFDPAPFFHVRNAETSPVFYIVAGFIAQWHMPLFFLLAGWSALTSIRSRGARGFFNERARKILIPLVAGCVFFGPVLKYYELRSGLDLSHTGLRVSDEIRRSLASVTDYAFAPLPPFHESFAAFWPTYFTRLDRFTWSHLWFLAYLFAMSITLTPLLLFLRGLRRRNDDVHSSLLYAPLVPLLIVQLTLRGRFPGIYNLYNDWANIAFYGVYFLSGALLAGPAGAERAVAREWKRALSIGTAAMLVLLLTALQLIRHPMVPLVTSTIAGWCFVLGLVGLARALNPANSSTRDRRRRVLPRPYAARDSGEIPRPPVLFGCRNHRDLRAAAPDRSGPVAPRNEAACVSHPHPQGGRPGRGSDRVLARGRCPGRTAHDGYAL